MSHAHFQRFRFYAQGVEFFPSSGTRLSFRSRGVDALSVKCVPRGTLAGGDAVTVTYQPTEDAAPSTVFAGTVEQVSESSLAGRETYDDAVVSSPWSKMDRLVYQQQWGTPYGLVWSSGLVLNQGLNGRSIGFKSQLNEILAFASGRCGFTFDTLSGGQELPFDEVRDLTCAQAMNRVLRWFPKTVVRFDYSAGIPKILFAEPAPAPWIDEIDKSSVVRTLNAHPVSGVCVETVTTGDSSGAPYRAIANQIYPPTSDPSGVDVMHVTVNLAGASGSNTYETFSTVCDSEIDSSNPGWWKKYHPRLAKVSIPDITVKEHSFRSDMGDYPRKAGCSVEELVKFGLKARVETFTARISLKENGDGDREEDMVLQMKFVTTNAVSGKVYSRVVGSTSTSGETIPDGLARAIYEDRSATLQSIECTARVGASFPTVGETFEGLQLQSFEVDPANLTVKCHFGQPEHLSADDMAGLLSGFRNRIRSTSSFERNSGEKVDKENAKEFIGPIESTEFCPGVKSKTTIKSTENAGGIIHLDSSKLEPEDDVDVRDLTYKDDAGEDVEVKVLASEDIEIPEGVRSVNGESGKITVAGGNKIKVETSGKTITISYDEGDQPGPGPGPDDPDNPPSDDDGPHDNPDPCADHPGTYGDGGAPAEGDGSDEGEGGVKAGGEDEDGVGCEGCK